ACLLLCLCLIAGCKDRATTEVQNSRLNSIIPSLESSDPALKQKAIADLKELAAKGLTFEEGRQALKAATKNWTDDVEPDSSEALVNAALTHPASDYAPLIVDDFTHFSRKARYAAVIYLVGDGKAGAEGFLKLVSRPGISQVMPSVGLSGFLGSPE